MTTLVTGATGFIGRRLVERLLERGEPVRVLVRPGPRAAALQDLPVELAFGRLEEAASLRPAVADIRTLYHCAALSSDWGPWEEFHAANVLGVRHLLQAAAGAGTVKRFVHVSTTDVYGYPETPCDESAPLRDVGLSYNRSKVLGEKEVLAAQAATGLAVTIVRPATVYGPGSKDWIVEAGRLLLSGGMVVIGGGRSRAGLIYVDDAVDAMIAAAASPCTIGQAYNLRHPEDATWRELYDRLADGLGAPRVRLDLPRSLAAGIGWASEVVARALGSRKRPVLTRHAVYLLSRDQGYPIDKSRRDFGFTPTHNLDEGLADTLRWLDTPEGRGAVPRPN